MAAPGIAGVLHPYRISGIEQQVGSALERLLHAGNDQHLLSRALHARARYSDMRRPPGAADGIPAPRRRTTIAPKRAASGGPTTWAHSVVGKTSSAAWLARKARVMRGSPPGHIGRRRAYADQSTRRGPAAFPALVPRHLQQIVGQHLTDISAGADFAFHVALGLQLLKGGHHGGAGESYS